MKKIKPPKLIFHFSFFVFLALSFVFDRGVLFLMYALCLILHEGAHAFVAKRRGYEIGRIKLMATGAVLQADSDEFTFSDEILIALSGPLFNLFVALVLICLWWIFPTTYNYTLDLCVINLSIFAFNMVPIFPLDGGRILLAFLSKKTERKTAVKICRAVTIILSFALFLLFVFSFFYQPNFSVGLMSVTLFLSGVSEDKMAVYRRATLLVKKKARVKKSALETRTIMIDEKVSESKMFSLLSGRYYTIFLLVDGDLNVKKRLTESELLKSIKEKAN